MYVTKEKNRYSKSYKKNIVCRLEIGPKHFNKLKPKPGPQPVPTYNSTYFVLRIPEYPRLINASCALLFKETLKMMSRHVIHGNPATVFAEVCRHFYGQNSTRFFSAFLLYFQRSKGCGKKLKHFK